MGDHDDDNPATMMLPQVQDPPSAPATERIPAMFAEQSASGGRPPSNAPVASSVKTTPMPMPALGATMMLPETPSRPPAPPRPGATVALPPGAFQPPPAPREGNAGTLIIDSASVLAAAGVTLPPPPAPPAPPSTPPPPIASVRPIALAPQPPARAPYDSISGRETPPPPLESLQAVKPAEPIGSAAPLPASPPNVIVPFADSPPRERSSGKSGAGGVLLVLLGALLVGVAAAALLVTGTIPSPWFAAKKPGADPSASAEVSATAEASEAAPPAESSPPPPPESASAESLPTDSASASASASESAPSASATASASMSATATSSGPLPTPALAVSVQAGDAYLLSYQGYLTVRSNKKADVVLQGIVSGKTNYKMMVRCGQRNVRLRETKGDWLTEGTPITITCMQHTVTTIDL